MKWAIEIVFPCLLMVALCSSLPVKSSLRDKSTKNMLKQRRNGEEISRDQSIQLIAMGISHMDTNFDGHIDRHELESVLRTMNPNFDEDSVRYLAGIVLRRKDFEHDDGELPIHDLAIFFHDVSDMGIF